MCNITKPLKLTWKRDTNNANIITWPKRLRKNAKY